MPVDTEENLDLQDGLSTAWAELDLHGATTLRELLRTLKKGFSTLSARVEDFPATREALRELEETFPNEAAVEKRLQLQEKLELEEASNAGGAKQGSRRLCVMVDGSLQAAKALEWAAGNVAGREDDLWLATVVPSEASSEDSGRILADA